MCLWFEREWQYNCQSENVDISIFDSKYSRPSKDTEILLAKLINTDKSAITVKMANVTKQSGSSDCGLYAIAYITHIAFGLNPSLHVFNQSSTRQHFLKFLENKHLQPFPTSKAWLLRYACNMPSRSPYTIMTEELV